jgi:putative selenium metabolism protein SsnA
MLITHARIVTWGEPNQLLEDHALAIQGNRIIEIGPRVELLGRYPEEDQVDAGGQIVMPGNICAHTHFYGAFARGMAIPGTGPRDFPEILAKLWWPLDKSLTYEDVRYSALVCLIEAVKHGTTCLIDHHASPNAIAGSLDVIAEAVEQAGVRAVLCYEVTDRDGEAKAQQGIQENARFLRRCQQEKISGGLVSAAFGLHAGLTLSDSTLEACRQAAPEGTGFHIHVAEDEADQRVSQAKSGMPLVEWLAGHGILGPHTIAAHAVHVDSREIDLLAETATWVSHQPRSNMNNGVGVAPVEKMLVQGVRVCLGNDGLSNAMWEEWKAAYLVHKVWHHDPSRMPAPRVVNMAVRNNAALVGEFFSDSAVGLIAPGAFADLIFVDYMPITPLSADNLPWHLLFGFHESMVTATMVNGKFLMRDRKLLTLNEQAITTRSRELAAQVWKRYEEQFGLQEKSYE